LNIASRFTRVRMASAAATERERSWVFTSATLGHDPQLRWFTEACGLRDAAVLRVDSPFDYPRQAALYVPADLPEPGDSAHSASVAALVAGAATQMGGRTLVLTTTLKAMRFIGDALTAYFERQGDIDVLVQGRGSKRDLLARFRANATAHDRPCVLVGSVSFWEGFDVPGNALQLLVIDKLPFPPPHDPLVQARSKELESRGRDPFNDYFLSEAAISLKQGAGRLIRSETDLGLLVITDPRLRQMPYGRKLRAALPAMGTLDTEADAMAWLAEIAAASAAA
jgi:ATP-dependent DNA helicase DinG